MIAAIFLITILVSIIIVLIWYIRKLLTIIGDTTEGIKDMKEAINAFSEHLQAVYKQETYYGEPTIERLIKHSMILVQEMEQFIRLFLNPNPQIEQTEDNVDEKKTEQQ